MERYLGESQWLLRERTQLPCENQDCIVLVAITQEPRVQTMSEPCGTGDAPYAKPLTVSKGLLSIVNKDCQRR